MESALTITPPMRSRQFQRRARLAARGGACDKNGVDGQGDTLVSDTAEIARFEALAEEALSAIYDARGADVRAALEDARYNIERAIDIARMRGLTREHRAPDQAPRPHPGGLRHRASRSAPPSRDAGRPTSSASSAMRRIPCTCRLPDVGREIWLSPGRALEIPFDHDPVQVLERARTHFAKQPVDVNVVRADGRRKKLLIADMDSTIINCECLDELADMAGIKAKVAAITERAMRGELEFEAALRERVAMLKGLPLAALDRVYAERIRLNPGAKTPGRHHARARRAHASGLGRLFLFHLARGEGRRLSCRTGQRSAR